MSILAVDRPNSSFGSVFMSDSTGQFFSTIHRHVSVIDQAGIDSKGSTEFERMPGIEGVALMNEVTNPEQATLGRKKHLRTKISMDNGRYWRPVKAPSVDVNGKPFDCTVRTAMCSVSSAPDMHIFNF